MANTLKNLLEYGLNPVKNRNSLSDLARSKQYEHSVRQPIESLQGQDPLTDWGISVAQRFQHPLEAMAGEAQRITKMSPEELAGQFGGGMAGTTSVAGKIDDIVNKWINQGVKLDAYANKANPNIITVSKIIVPKEARGQGIGTSAMQDIINTANAEGKTIALSPSADFGGSKTKLTEWYKSLGFVPNKGKNIDYSISESMYKVPDK